MSNLEKEVEKLHRDFVAAKNKLENEQRGKEVTKNLDPVGIDPKAPTKNIPGSADIPDVVLLPKKQKRTENKW